VGAYRALLFDLDGTLAETDSLHRPTWVEALAPHGITVDEAFYRDRISGRSNARVLEELLPDLSAEEALGIAAAKEAAFRELAGDLEPLPGLIAFVEGARERGLRLALVTNAPRENVVAVLAALGLADDFDDLVLADEVGEVKPDPGPYEAALVRLGVAAGEALAFEDSASGIASSTGAGVPTVGVASTQSPRTLEEAGAFAVIEDFTDPNLEALLRHEG
jgi:HAD superfamily hydrolase (TIGR01509 family)